MACPSVCHELKASSLFLEADEEQFDLLVLLLTMQKSAFAHMTGV